MMMTWRSVLKTRGCIYIFLRSSSRIDPQRQRSASIWCSGRKRNLFVTQKLCSCTSEPVHFSLGKVFPNCNFTCRMFLYSSGTLLNIDAGGGWKWKTRCGEGGCKSTPPYVLYNKVDLLWNVRIWGRAQVIYCKGQ